MGLGGLFRYAEVVAVLRRNLSPYAVAETVVQRKVCPHLEKGAIRRCGRRRRWCCLWLSAGCLSNRLGLRGGVT